MTIDRWFRELSDLGNALKERKIVDVEFQSKLEDLYRRVDLVALCSFVKLDEIEKNKLPDNGALRIERLPGHSGFGKQVFGCKKGRAIVPHGHSNMCTGFVVLRGQWRGRHYDRLESHADHCVVRQTIDRQFAPGDFSTISDHKNNIHWFEAESDAAYIFNVYVTGYDPAIKGSGGRIYLDVDSKTLAVGALVKAPRMTSATCHNKYGSRSDTLVVE